jgi:hypothetical protein
MTEPPPEDHTSEPHLGALDTPPGADPVGWNPTGSSGLSGEPGSPPASVTDGRVREAEGKGFWARLLGLRRR